MSKGYYWTFQLSEFLFPCALLDLDLTFLDIFRFPFLVILSSNWSFKTLSALFWVFEFLLASFIIILDGVMTRLAELDLMFLVLWQDLPYLPCLVEYLTTYEFLVKYWGVSVLARGMLIVNTSWELDFDIICWHEGYWFLESFSWGAMRRGWVSGVWWTLLMTIGVWFEMGWSM